MQSDAWEKKPTPAPGTHTHTHGYKNGLWMSCSESADRSWSLWGKDSENTHPVARAGTELQQEGHREQDRNHWYMKSPAPGAAPPPPAPHLKRDAVEEKDAQRRRSGKGEQPLQQGSAAWRCLCLRRWHGQRNGDITCCHTRTSEHHMKGRSLKANYQRCHQ